MKRTLSLFCIGLLAIACEKNTADDTPENTFNPVDTAGIITLDPYNRGQGYDTTGNYIASYRFSKHDYYTTLASFTASNNSGTHYIRYVGGEPLFTADSVFDRGGQVIGLHMNKHLCSKKIFEVREIGTDKLYKTIIAHRDSVTIDYWFSIWDNYFVGDKAISNVAYYLMHIKQTDTIKYRVVL